MVSDDEMRKMLKKMIENDKVHAEKLKEFEKAIHMINCGMIVYIQM
jgi:rubrerythrin